MDEMYNRCLLNVEDLLLSLGVQRLDSYGLPVPKQCEEFDINMDYLRELNYNTELLKKCVSDNENCLSNKQLKVYTGILNSVKNNSGKVFFLDAPGDTSKTCLINLPTLSENKK